jgi:hypothetical protein
MALTSLSGEKVRIILLIANKVILKMGLQRVNVITATVITSILQIDGYYHI